MSFTDMRSKYGNMGAESGVNSFEKAYLAVSTQIDVDEERAVELFVDDLRGVLCCFDFKEPLAGDFYEARDHALNCLEMGDVSPRQVHHWVNDSLKCVDVMVIVYLRDVLSEPIRAKSKNPKEREVYDCCQTLDDNEIRSLGLKLEAVYQKRSDPLIHHQVVDENGRRQIRKVSGKKKLRIYEFARCFIKESLDILIPRFRKAYPEACTDIKHA